MVLHRLGLDERGTVVDPAAQQVVESGDAHPPSRVFDVGEPADQELDAVPVVGAGHHVAAGTAVVFPVAHHGELPRPPGKLPQKRLEVRKRPEAVHGVADDGDQVGRPLVQPLEELAFDGSHASDVEIRHHRDPQRGPGGGAEDVRAREQSPRRDERAVDGGDHGHRHRGQQAAADERPPRERPSCRRPQRPGRRSRRRRGRTAHGGGPAASLPVATAVPGPIVRPRNASSD